VTASTDFALSCPVPLPPGEAVLLGHGSGGKLTNDLIRTLFVPLFAGDGGELARLGDAAVVEVDGARVAFTTDGFVVTPKFFPGSDIGALSIFGTANDLAMMGARPLFVSAALILEEGYPMQDLARIAASMADACREAGVRLVTGDTKVVERGAADGLFVTTSGIGIVAPDVRLGPDLARPGDSVIVSGPIGSHGVTVMSRRAGIGFDTTLTSDSAPLTGLVQAMLAAGEVHCLRDATRGGIASAMNELAAASGVGMTIEENAVPMLPAVRGACEMLGLDPFYVANEGVCVAIVADRDAESILTTARAHPLGGSAQIVGVVDEPDERDGISPVRVRSGLGGYRPLLMLAGEQLPRIC
jgi:hydrogenase expression/formation protein HypE